jgi:hypothetical protein
LPVYSGSANEPGGLAWHVPGRVHDHGAVSPLSKLSEKRSLPLGGAVHDYPNGQYRYAPRTGWPLDAVENAPRFPSRPRIHD